MRLYLLLLIIIVFYSYLGANPISISQFLGAKLGQAIGMEVSVPENPFNRLALQLKEKEDALKIREQELDQREQNFIGKQDKSPLNYYLGGAIIALFFLILLNYYLDYKRRKKNLRQ